MTDYYEDTHDLTQEDIATFLEAMASGREIEAGSEIHRIMVAASERAMRITARMNSSFRSLSETRDVFGELLMERLPDGVGLSCTGASIILSRIVRCGNKLKC